MEQNLVWVGLLFSLAVKIVADVYLQAQNIKNHKENSTMVKILIEKVQKLEEEIIGLKEEIQVLKSKTRRKINNAV